MTAETETPPHVARALRAHFGHDALRPGQAAALAPVLAGRDTLVVMPTGAGKSLVYQLGALLREDGVTVVVSPLIALMKDQVDGLRARGIAAVAVNSSQSEAERREALADVRSGRARLVYAAPERLRLASFQRVLAEVGVSLFAVDEAHCVSQWGHDFRPDYLALAEARAAVGSPPVVALTATGTPRVQDDICDQLAMRDPARLVTGFDRPNLTFLVETTPGVREKREALVRFIGRHAGEGGMVYVSTRREAEDLGAFVRERTGQPCGVYHAGLPDAERSDVQERFLSGRLDLVVATNAFGMGVDRPDVRFVAHWGIPSTLEAYYQEAGRAGRDGQPATAVLFYAPQDRQLREWFIEQQAPALDDLRAVHAALDRLAGDDAIARGEPDDIATRADRHPVGGRVALTLLERAGLAERLDPDGPSRAWRVARWNERAARQALGSSDRLREAKARDLAGIVGYAQSADCRRRRILDHFGDDAPTEVAPDACCDVCRANARLRARPDAIPDWDALPMASRIALGLLDAVRRTRWPVGRLTLAKILAGSEAKGMDRHARHPYYGRLKHVGQAEIDRLYKQLLVQGYLRIGGGEYPVVELTPVGAQALEHREAITLDGAASAAPRRASASFPDEALSPTEAALFEALRAWRAEIARARAVPPYVVFGDKTLRAVAQRRPAGESDLLAVPGVGPAKFEQYGADVLALVAEHDA